MSGTACDRPGDGAHVIIATGRNEAGWRVRGAAIVASIPGRLRLRDVRLRDARRCQALGEALNKLVGVVRIETMPATASVLLHYDHNICSRAAFEQAALATLAAIVPAPSRQVREASRSRPERRWNRAAKWGMLISFPVSLALAAAGGKKLHVATGGLFSTLLLVHLYVHRRHWLK